MTLSPASLLTAPFISPSWQGYSMRLLATATGFTDLTAEWSKQQMASQLESWLGHPLVGCRIAFLAAAAEVIPKAERHDLTESVEYLRQLGCTVLVLDSYTPPPEARRTLTEADILYAGGGNPAYLLHVLTNLWQAHGLLIELIKQQKPYIGSSAGSIILGKHLFLLRGAPRGYRPVSGASHLKGVGLINGFVIPHPDAVTLRLAVFLRGIGFNPLVLPTGEFRIIGPERFGGLAGP